MNKSKKNFTEVEKKYLEIISSIKHKELKKLSHCQYLINDQVAGDDFGDVELQFEDGTIITLFILSDGQSVGAKYGSMEIRNSFYLSDKSKCSWQRVLLTELKPWSLLTGESVTEVAAIFDRLLKQETDILMGWKITFGKSGYLCYFNNGDNGMLLFNQEPPQMKDIETFSEQI